jgi:hypothetical protein
MGGIFMVDHAIHPGMLSHFPKFSLPHPHRLAHKNHPVYGSLDTLVSSSDRAEKAALVAYDTILQTLGERNFGANTPAIKAHVLSDLNNLKKLVYVKAVGQDSEERAFARELLVQAVQNPVSFLEREQILRASEHLLD